MRIFALLFVVMLSSGLHAAPQAGLTAERKKALEVAWAELAQAKPEDFLRACLVLSQEPKSTVEFLKTKLVPVAITKAQAKTWLKDLDSEDEKTWKPAYAALHDHSPLLVFTVREIWSCVEENLGRFRVTQLLGMSHIVDGRVDLSVADGVYEAALYTASDEVFQYFARYKANRGFLSDVYFYPFEKHENKAWIRAAVAIDWLARQRTPDTDALLDELTKGHESALPTLAAKQAVKARAAPRAVLRSWNDLSDSDSRLMASAIFDWIGEPAKSIAELKARLKPIRVTVEQAKAWLTDLDSRDEKTWHEAYRHLSMNHALLVLTPPEAWDCVSTNEGRHRACAVIAVNGSLDDFAKEKNDREYPLSLKLDRGSYCVLWINADRTQAGQGISDSKFLDTPEWCRCEQAILVLEHIGTPEAKAVIETVAKGHEDAKPTKAAKAALERLKKK